MFTVLSQAAWSNWPMPFGDGQIRPLISFIIQVWCPVLSSDPAFTTRSAHFW